MTCSFLNRIAVRQRLPGKTLPEMTDRIEVIQLIQRVAIGLDGTGKNTDDALIFFGKDGAAGVSVQAGDVAVAALHRADLLHRRDRAVCITELEGIGIVSVECPAKRIAQHKDLLTGQRERNVCGSERSRSEVAAVKLQRRHVAVAANGLQRNGIEPAIAAAGSARAVDAGPELTAGVHDMLTGEDDAVFSDDGAGSFADQLAAPINFQIDDAFRKIGGNLLNVGSDDGTVWAESGGIPL